MLQSGQYLHTLLIFCLVSSYSSAKNQEHPRYDTAYACEGKTLQIECKDGELINLIRANYGRFSITICNDHGNTEWSVNCMSPKSLRVLHARCSQQQNCSIQASTTLFGEPCAGTLKYLEAHYQCIPPALTTTTSRPSPPWLITSQPSVWSTAKVVTIRGPVGGTPAPGPPPLHVPGPTTARSVLGVTTGKNVAAEPTNRPSTASTVHAALTTSLPTDQPTVPSSTAPPGTPPPARLTDPPPTQPTQPSTTQPPGSLHATRLNLDENDICPPSTARGLTWNWTRAGEVGAQPCPGGATGVARWRCVSGPPPRRATPTPDLSECRSVWLTSLDARISEEDSIINIANDLSQVTNSKTLYGGDMMTTTKIMKRMSKKMQIDIQTFPDPRQREAIVTELLHGVVRTGSNLLEAGQLSSWRDLSHREQMRVATSLLVGIEENSFLLANTVVREKTVTHTEKNIFLAVRVVEVSNVETEEFRSHSTRSGSDEDWGSNGGLSGGSVGSVGSGGGGGESWLRLEKRALVDNSEGSLVRLVYASFDRLEEILRPGNTSRVVNSKVISASLGQGRHIQLSYPVTICLKHIRTENVTNPTCVFWDYTMSSWSEEGCRKESTNATHTICVCDHLTNFAVLMDVQQTYLPPAHELALQIITYIGCIVSIICLILAIATFHLFRGLKSDRTTIHKNLCGCLLIAEILFLAGIGQTDQAIICAVVAGLLHFFFLCAFAWMFLEGFQLYVMLIEVFEAEKSRVRWYYLFGYGAPLVIVSVSSLVDPLSYGTDRYCWLRADNFFIFSFVGPVIAVILANLVFLSMAIYMMCRHANASVAMKSKEQSRLASARGGEDVRLHLKFQSKLAWLRGAIVLVFLLGLTWTFGLLYLNRESVIMAYVFTVLNTLQGLFIFVFHCVQNDKVQKEYRKIVRRHSWLSRCVGCEERSSGAGSSGSGSGESKERRTSLYTGHAHSTESTSGGSSGIAGPVGISSSSHHPPGHHPGPTNHHGTSNISFKSFSRDSGHGGSEQEESPKGQTTVLTSNSLLRHKDKGGYGGYGSSGSHGAVTLGARAKRANGSLRATSPWNHTYTEIRERRVAGGSGATGSGITGSAVPVNNGPGLPDDDPVYEEIERERERAACTEVLQVSDMSDEDGRRVSDMSRQSSRSYGDHRPLIPYTPASVATDRNFHAAFDAAFRQRLKEQAAAAVGHHHATVVAPHQGTVAVLDGETVVCHLQPDYTSRTTLHHQPYSEC
ncbi:latrophilin Cirl-like isoform X2 [Rhodnius prolixus]|uniref:latrophilin Cirl-like isoform X2 n=1 Tax=Rhodnius prolixus TaxID=13249 RepID=UPI003D18AEDC